MPFRFGIFGCLINHGSSRRNSQRRRSGVREQELTSIAPQAAPVTPSLSTQPLTPPYPSAVANETADLPQSHSVNESSNMVITDGQFNQIRGHHTQIHGRRHTNVVINLNQTTSGNRGSPTSSLTSNETHHINLAPSSSQSTYRPRTQLNHDNSQASSQNQEIILQKNNDIYERHLILKGRGFPLWIPEPNQVLHSDYRRTGVRIGDVGIITHSGGFSFLFNICLPHDDPVNPRTLPEHFSPISPPIDATDIEKFLVFNDGSHLASESIKRSQTSAVVSGIVFESSASEGAILTMPRGARSEDLGNFARFREYAAANVADWYKFVNGPRGREAKNGDVRLVVGFDKTTSWGIATFANQAQQNNCRLRFGPSEGASSTTPTSTYRWEYSGVVEVKAGPGTGGNDELRRDNDPPDVQFENQCLFVRTLNVTLTDDVWTDIHSSLASVHVNYQHSRYPHVKDSNHPHSSNPGTGSSFNFSPSQGEQYGTQRARYDLQNVDVASDNNPTMFISGPPQSLMVHPSKVLNDILLAKVPTAKMVITHDDDWSSVIRQYDTLPDPHKVVENILASRKVCEENGVIFLQPKKLLDEISEGSTSMNCVQAASEAIAADLTEAETLFNEKVVERKVSSGKSSKGKERQNKPRDYFELGAFHLRRSRSEGDIYASTLTQDPTVGHFQLPQSRSEGNIPLYNSTLAQEPSVVGLPTQSDIIIAVIGPTGAGKSTFINKAAGFKESTSDPSLESCTHTVQVVRYLDKQQNRRVVFVDTPGFSGTNISDFDVLQLIANWLKLTYGQDIRLSGLLFFHRISDNRMDGSPMKYLKMFQDLCGNDGLKNVVLVTTMWDEVEEEEGCNLEKQLSDHYWKLVLELGCRTARFYNNAGSAWDIVSQFQGALCSSPDASIRVAPAYTEDEKYTSNVVACDRPSPDTAVEASAAVVTSAATQDIKIVTNILPDDLLIAFMGPTGSGKTHMIKTLSLKPGPCSGSLELSSSAPEIRAVRLLNHPKHGDRIVLVDAPAFGYKGVSEVEVLQRLGDWLRKICEVKITLTGIVYLHRIINNRLAGASYHSLRMFGELCGNQALKVVLVTTAWDEVDLRIGEEQERALCEDHWKEMIEGDASVARFQNTTASAWKIIGDVLEQDQSKVPPLKEGLLSDIKAGKPLNADMSTPRRLIDTSRLLASDTRRLSTESPHHVSPTRTGIKPQLRYSSSQNRHFNNPPGTLTHPTFNPEYRGLIRTAASLICEAALKPPLHMTKTEAGLRDWGGVEVRIRSLARLERIWDKSGKTAVVSSINVSAGEERERRLFCDALRDGYVLCQLMNKIRPNSIVRPNSRVDGFVETPNVTKFLTACASYGLSDEDLFQRDDLIEATSESLARVAKTVIALFKLADLTPKFISGQAIPTSSSSVASYGQAAISRASSAFLSKPIPSALSSAPSRKRWSPLSNLSTLRSHSPDDNTDLNDCQSISSSTLAESTGYSAISSIFGGRSSRNSVGTVRTMMTDLTSEAPSVFHADGTLIAEDLVKKQFTESTGGKYGKERKMSELDLSRVMEETDESLSSKRHATTATLVAHNNTKSHARSQELEKPAFYLRKGKALEAQSTPFSIPRRKIGAVDAAASRGHDGLISAREPIHRLRHAPRIIMPKDAVLRRHGIKLAPSSRNGPSPDPFPQATFVGGTAASSHHSAAEGGAKTVLQNERPRVLHGHFQPEIESASSSKKPASPSSYELDVRHVRSRFESMNDLGLESGMASADDFISRDPLDENALAVRKKLVVRENGKTPTHFQLGNCIGLGRFGSVYRAMNLNTGQMVAVKEIRLEGMEDDEVNTLIREVDLMKALSHPSIVKYEGIARGEDTLSIVLDYAENGSLGQTLKVVGKFNERLVASYVVKILEGLHYLHTSDVVHCDLKAANILMTTNGNVKLSDFGMSLNLRAMDKHMAWSSNWTAPEVIELKGASTKSDIWSLGCTIIELLTGRPPYAEIMNSMSVMFRIVEDDAMPLPEGCSELLQDFLEQCFHKNPMRRPSAELLFEHMWLKKNWELRPQDNIPFLRRVSTDFQKSVVVHHLSQMEMSDPSSISSTGRRTSHSSVHRDDEISPREHSFVKTTFSKPMICRVCLLAVKKSAVLCSHCSLISHAKCAISAPPTCNLRAQLLLCAQSEKQSNLAGVYSPPADQIDVTRNLDISDVTFSEHSRTSKDTTPSPSQINPDPPGARRGSKEISKVTFTPLPELPRYNDVTQATEYLDVLPQDLRQTEKRGRKESGTCTVQ